jgi:FKBP-type peptidyl-prolyl cis-trans isomerase
MLTLVNFRRGAGLVAMMGLVVAGIAICALAAFAQPAKVEPKKDEPNVVPMTPINEMPAEGDAARKAEPAMGEAPDGTMMPIIARGALTVQFEDLKVGDGKEATAASTITFHYHGTLASNGKMFDSTRGKEPATYPLGRLIPGLHTAVPGMKVGGIRVVRIPAAVGYRDRVMPAPDGSPLIPPGSDLVFSIELKDVK